MARRAWEELRPRLIREVCSGGGVSLKPLALIRGDEVAMARLQEMVTSAKNCLPDAGLQGRARLASLLDLCGEHREALQLLQPCEQASASDAASQLLFELIRRHVELADERAGRLQQQSSPSNLPVEVLDAATTSREEVLERFIRPGRPCVLRGVHAAPRWTPQELKLALGNQKVPLRHCDDTSASWAKLEFVGAVSVDEFVAKHIEPYNESNPAPRDAPQLFDFSIWQQCTDSLGSQVMMPTKWFPVDLYTYASARVHPVTGSAAPTLFLAAKGSGSSLHVDFLQTNFWMAMCHGRKRWRLVSKDDLCMLYPRYLTDLNPVFPADLNEVEEEQQQPGTSRFPGLGQVVLHEVILEPGDLIFVPRGWPHQVDNLETSVAISANFIDASNVADALAEAEVLGLVSEDPRFIAEALQDAVASKLPDRLAAEAPAEEPLRAFKARHKEVRAPHETQGRIVQAAALVTVVGVGLGFAIWVSRKSTRQVTE